MKEIKAYIKVFKREQVAHSLMKIEGVTGASFSQVIGFGRGKDKSSGYSPENDPFGYVKHLKVEIVCDDDLEEQVVRAIHKGAHTGLRGDGRIFVSDVSRGDRIENEVVS